MERGAVERGYAPSNFPDYQWGEGDKGGGVDK